MSDVTLVPYLKQPDPAATVARHNNLIEAQYYASPQEQRLFLWAVSQAQADAHGRQVFQVEIAELARYVGIEGNSNIYAQMVDVTDRASRRSIRIRNLENDEFVQSNLMNARYRKGSGTVEIEIPGFLVPYILNMKNKFTKVELRTVMQLGSGHSMRLYDLLKSRLYRTHDIEVEIDALQLLLGVADKYVGRFNNFRQHLLEPACKEINTRTELRVAYSVIPAKSDKRKAGSIVFHVDGEALSEAAADNPVLRRLRAAGLKADEAVQAWEVWGESDPDRITWHLDELEKKLKAGTVKSPTAWLKVGLRDDYRPAGSELQRKIAADKAARAAKERAKADEEGERDRQAAARSAARVRAIEAVMEGLDAGERAKLADDVTARLKVEAMRRAWMNHKNFGSELYAKEIAAAIRARLGIDIETSKSGSLTV